MRIRKNEVESSYDFEEAWLGEFIVWPQAPDYRIAAGYIDPKPGSNLGRFPPPSPFEDGDLLLSFARLGATGEPSPTSIMKWVRKYGLLTRADESLSGDQLLPDKSLSGDQLSADGRVNQKPMEVRRFTEEVFRVRGLLSLYVQIRGREYAAVRLRSLEPQSAVDRGLAAYVMPLLSEDYPEMVRRRSFNEAMGSLALSSVIARADQFLADELSKSLAPVRLRVVPGFKPPSGFRFNSEDPEATSAMMRAHLQYRLGHSWHCPDLLTAIYLQLFLLATKNTPMRFCEECQTPLPAKPKQRRFCNATCRSNARNHR